MSLNSSAAQPPLSPQQQDTGLPAALPPNTPDVANPSEPEQTEPVLANRSANNSSAELAVELNQPPTLIAEHSAPEKSDRSSSASLEAESAITDDEITSLKKAAERGNAEAHFKLALRYLYGNGVQCDESITSVRERQSRRSLESSDVHKALTNLHLARRCDSQRTRRYEFGTRTGGASPFSAYADSHDTCR